MRSARRPRGAACAGETLKSRSVRPSGSAGPRFIAEEDLDVDQPRRALQALSLPFATLFRLAGPGVHGRTAGVGSASAWTRLLVARDPYSEPSSGGA